MPVGTRAARWVEHLRLTGAIWPTLIVLGFFAGTTVIVMSGEERLPWAVNQQVDRPITARVDFQRMDETKTAQSREATRRSIPNYFRVNQQLLDHVTGELRQLLTAARAADSFEKLAEAGKNRWKVDAGAFETLKRLSEEPKSDRYLRWVQSVGRQLRDENLVQLPTAMERDPLTESAEDAVLDRGEGRLDHVSKQRLSFVTNHPYVIRTAKELAEQFPAGLRATVTDLIVRAVIVDADKQRYQPVYAFDRDRTKQALEAAAKISPVYEKYQHGDVLVPAGTTITAALLDLLRQEHEQYLTARSGSRELYRPWLYKRLGQTGLVLFVALGLAAYTLRFQPRVAENPLRGVALALLLLSMLLISRLMVVQQWSEWWALATTTVAAAILTIAYSQRFALGVSAALTTLTTMTLGVTFTHFMVLTAVAGLVVFSLNDIRSRIKLLKVGTAAAAVGGLATFLVGLTQQQAPMFVVGQAGIGATAVMIGCAIVLVLLPLIERAFGVATSMTLLEWADTSTPLLKQVIQRAPGTWQHSHLLGTMAESAADQIGANGLLVRVGAYYHDIGKMCKPEYFVENQQADVNAHERIAPRLSLLIILGHVRDGLALAREHRLPRVLHQFIAEHHGTTVVRYFHASATQDQLSRGGDPDDPSVDETEFRYPGPRPRSKESAILMLCDSIEGRVRTLSDPTPGRIEGVVHEVAMQRLMDSQLDDCDITLKELARVEQDIVKSLCSIYHGRITYPKSATEPLTPPIRTRSA